MTKKEVQEKLEKEKNAKLMLEVEYEDKKYIRAMTIGKNHFEYYELKENEILEIEDKEVLEYLRSIYEIQEKNIVY